MSVVAVAEQHRPVLKRSSLNRNHHHLLHLLLPPSSSGMFILYIISLLVRFWRTLTVPQLPSFLSTSGSDTPRPCMSVFNVLPCADSTASMHACCIDFSFVGRAILTRLELEIYGMLGIHYRIVKPRATQTYIGHVPSVRVVGAILAIGFTVCYSWLLMEARDRSVLLGSANLNPLAFVPSIGNLLRNVYTFARRVTTAPAEPDLFVTISSARATALLGAVNVRPSTLGTMPAVENSLVFGTIRPMPLRIYPAEDPLDLGAPAENTVTFANDISRGSESTCASAKDTWRPVKCNFSASGSRSGADAPPPMVFDPTVPRLLPSPLIRPPSITLNTAPDIAIVRDTLLDNKLTDWLASLDSTYSFTSEAESSTASLVTGIAGALVLPVDDDGNLVLGEITPEIANAFGLPAPPIKRKTTRGGRRRTVQIRRQNRGALREYRAELIASGVDLPPFQALSTPSSPGSPPGSFSLSYSPCIP
ncbi:hypothetical protein B0H21DRAFT_826604 [Amylocystis lapponica]|nr:hypothetical protein B0H21DRAFT_826604 [Amylocystis lapponica]